MNDFAHIHTLRDRQVLFYTESSDEGFNLHIVFRLKNGTNVGMKMGFPDEKKLIKAFAESKKGTHDGTIGAQIDDLEKNLKVVEDKS